MTDNSTCVTVPHAVPLPDTLPLSRRAILPGRILAGVLVFVLVLVALSWLQTAYAAWADNQQRTMTHALLVALTVLVAVGGMGLLYRLLWFRYNLEGAQRLLAALVAAPAHPRVRVGADNVYPVTACWLPYRLRLRRLGGFNLGEPAVLVLTPVGLRLLAATTTTDIPPAAVLRVRYRLPNPLDGRVHGLTGLQLDLRVKTPHDVETQTLLLIPWQSPSLLDCREHTDQLAAALEQALPAAGAVGPRPWTFPDLYSL